MKNLVLALSVVGLSLSLAACASDGQSNVDQAPFADERTVGSEEVRVAPVERTFTRVQRK